MVENTKACRDELERLGAKVSDTDNHLFLMNVLDSYGITGKEAQNKLEEIEITTNKNMIPGDTLSPNKTSGLRIGFAAVTTRGCTIEDAKFVGRLINNYLSNIIDKEEARREVENLTSKWKDISII